MKIKGSRKSSFSFAIVLLLMLLLFSKEAVNPYGYRIIIYLIVALTIIFSIELYFDKKETISHDSIIIHIDLAKYVGDIQIKDIQAIYLKDDINDLTIETDDSKHLYRLYGFQRKRYSNI